MIPLAKASVSAIPLDIPALEREVAELEHARALLDRRDAATEALSARGFKPMDALHAMSVADVIATVAARRGVHPEQIREHIRAYCISHPRQEVFYLLSLQERVDGSKRWSLPQIGVRVAGFEKKPFHHTTVLYGIGRHLERERAAAAGEKPATVYRTPSKARILRAAIRLQEPRPEGAATVCMLPATERCPGCGAPGGEPCNDGARRAG